MKITLFMIKRIIIIIKDLLDSYLTQYITLHEAVEKNHS